MASLKELAREQILEEVLGKVRPAGGWKILVVDHYALRMISACCRMFDIMDKGVTLVEDIRKSRQPLPKFECVYLVEPTRENVDLIKNDFKGTPKYEGVHIYFLDACSDELIKELATPRLKKVVRAINELNLNFVPTEARVFSMDNSRGMFDAYSPLGQGENIDDIAHRLAGVCAFLGDFPIVRYQAGRERNRQLADAVQRRLDVLKSFNPNAMSSDSRQRAQLIIVDRSVDLMAPLVHELTYQAAAYDLLQIGDDDTYDYAFKDARGREQSKKVVLNEQDDVWVEFRHHHLATVFSEITASFEAFRSKSTLNDARGQDGAAALKQTMKELPQFQQQMAKFGLHLDMASQINQAFTKDIERATMAEQNITTGVDSEGKKVSNPVSEISSVLVHKGTSSEEKLRLVMLCVLAMGGMKPTDLSQLQRTAHLSPEQCAIIENLNHLGATVQADKSSRKKKKKKKTEAKPETEYALSRFVPALKTVMEHAARYSLDLEEFPCTRDEQELRGIKRTDDEDDGEMTSNRKRGAWTAKPKKKAEKLSATARAKAEKRQRIIIYVIGGMSFNELRCAYEVSRGREVDVFIGSDTVLRPAAFLESVANLTNASAGQVSTFKQAALRVESQQEPSGAGGGLKFVPGRAQDDFDDDEV